ncbi:hypothetical protein O6H91_05G090500 [Diphasiastrum complanatum]|uniref:Uncharacterized protein n=1 Tax=Diphasiastrum complanatum TaxID=34168 RepID=A0ACC2DQR9_DIPCM|nr:hypothetical protein O6H91_05G090500 [Diphasiastrum complanatum]
MKISVLCDKNIIFWVKVVSKLDEWNHSRLLPFEFYMLARYSLRLLLLLNPVFVLKSVSQFISTHLLLRRLEYQFFPVYYWQLPPRRISIQSTSFNVKGGYKERASNIIQARFDVKGNYRVDFLDTLIGDNAT